MHALTPAAEPMDLTQLADDLAEPVSLAAELEHHRLELGDDFRFIMRCQDGAYGPLAAEIALDVVASGTGDGTEPTDARVADEILAEARQTEQDAHPLAA